jgi:hypothetical protein
VGPFNDPMDLKSTDPILFGQASLGYRASRVPLANRKNVFVGELRRGGSLAAGVALLGDHVAAVRRLGPEKQMFFAPTWRIIATVKDAWSVVRDLTDLFEIRDSMHKEVAPTPTADADHSVPFGADRPGPFMTRPQLR